MLLAPPGDDITLLSSLHASTGQSLALEQVKELRHLLHQKISEKIGHLPENMRDWPGKQVRRNSPSPAASTATVLAWSS